VIIRTVTIKVFRAGNKESYTHRTIAGKHRQFTNEGIKAILAEYEKRIETVAPGEYKKVKVGPGEFNFVHVAV
jgi:hypothetical protein